MTSNPILPEEHAVEPMPVARSHPDEPSNSDHRPVRWPKWSWQGFLTVASAMLGASAVLLHLLGSAIHQTYLSEWGIDAGQFPKSTDWLMIQGYYGFWSALGIAFAALQKNVLWVALAGVVFALYFAALVSTWTPFGARNDTPKLVAKVPSWVRRVFVISGAGGMLALGLVPLTLVLFLLVSVPAVVGKGIGEELAVKQAQDFAKGCIASKGACIRLMKDGKQIGEGYLIDSSPSHIAFLDTSLKRARVLAREVLELQATRLPASQ